MARGAIEPTASGNKHSGASPRRAHRGDLRNARKGHLGYASANGYFLSVVHSCGGFWAAAANSLRSRPLFQLLSRLRQAGAHHVHGLWLQRRWRDRLPDNFGKEGTDDRRAHQFPCSLQRQISHAYCRHHAVFAAAAALSPGWSPPQYWRLQSSSASPQRSSYPSFSVPHFFAAKARPSFWSFHLTACRKWGRCWSEALSTERCTSSPERSWSPLPQGL